MMLLRTWIAVACLVLGASTAQALELRGKAQSEIFGYLNSRQSASRAEGFFSISGYGRAELSPSVSLRGELELVADDADFTDPILSYRNSERQRAAIQVVEAALDFRPWEGWRFSAGRQLVQWSGIDEIRPIDVMRSRDQSDIFRQRDLGLYSLSGHFEGAQAYGDIVVVPMGFPLSTLPQGRWNIIDDERGKVVRAIDVPPIRFEETQVGLRLGVLLGSLDVAAIGYVGRDASPTFVPKVEFVGGIDRFQLTITDVYPKLRAGGLTASHPVGEAVLLRSEAMYFSSPDAVRDDFLHVVVGGEYGWGDWRLVANYMRDEITRRASEPVTDRGQRRFFRNFLFGEIRYDGFARVQPRLRGGYDFLGKFLVVRPEVSVRAWRSLFLVLSADVIDGRRFGYFERVRNEDRVGLRAEWHF